MKPLRTPPRALACALLIGALLAAPGFFLATPALANVSALDFASGSSQRVTFGAAPSLGLQQFTLELWFMRQGTGATASSGTGGIVAIPLVTKGRGEAEGSNVDMNWFLGIRGTDNKLAADFEDMAGGVNHPIIGTTTILNNVWYHAAATYDGTTWRLYLNGVLDGELAVGATPRFDSIQHAGLATAMTSTGATSGFFDGIIDEVRVWNYARTEADLLANRYAELTSGAGLVGRWGLDENSGTIIGNSIGGGVNGTAVNAPAWVAGFPGAPVAPDAPDNLTATAVIHTGGPAHLARQLDQRSRLRDRPFDDRQRRRLRPARHRGSECHLLRGRGRRARLRILLPGARGQPERQFHLHGAGVRHHADVQQCRRGSGRRLVRDLWPGARSGPVHVHGRAVVPARRGRNHRQHRHRRLLRGAPADQGSRRGRRQQRRHELVPGHPRGRHDRRRLRGHGRRRQPPGRSARPWSRAACGTTRPPPTTGPTGGCTSTASSRAPRSWAPRRVRTASSTRRWARP